MAITVKHSKTSAIPDAGDTTLVQPSDWNADHTLTGTVPVANGGTGAATLTGYVKGNGTAAMTASATVPSTDITGLGTMSTQNANNIAVTGGSISGTTVAGYIPTTEKAAALGVATLDAGGTVPLSQIPASIQGGVSYQGTWNASTNTPTLSNGVGTKGYYYVVSVAGSTNLDGITSWNVGDWAIFNGTVWQKVDNTDAVTSVNGYTGTVVLTTTDVAEGTNQYFTTARARTSVSAGTGISYNNTTGVITNSSPSLGGDVVGPASSTDNAVARFDTTTGKLIQNSVTLIDDTGNASGILSQQFSNGSAVTLAAGKMWYDGSTGSWNAGMGGGNITQQIGEELFVYGKASTAITDSPLQIVYQTGVVGASGVITFAPTIAGITDGTSILGIATENITLNNFGRATSYGVVRGITTNGTAFSETWADGDEIYYNPVTGNPTNIKPVAPYVKVSVGTLIKAGSGGSGSIQVEINHGSVLGGTDSNVQLTSVSNGQIISYDGGNGYWKNTDLTAGTAISVTETANGVLTVNNTGVTSAVAGTGISVSGATGAVTVTNTAPDQTVSIASGTGISATGTYPAFTVTNTAPDQTVALASGTGISVTGTYPSFTVTNTAPSSGGTVTSVTAGTGLSGGTITTSGTISLANTTVSTGSYTNSSITVDAQGRLTSASSGTAPVTSVTGTSPVVSSGGATPAISMPAATTSVNGYLTSTDWTTFNNKSNTNGTVTSVAALTIGTTGTDLSSTVATGTTTPVITLQVPTASAANRGALSAADWTTFNGKAAAFTYTSTYIPYGQGTTTPNQNANFTFDGTTQTAPVQRASNGIITNSKTISASYTIPATDNAVSAGPVTVSSGQSVTVSSGSRWVVL